jgi:hypothetical protein
MNGAYFFAQLEFPDEDARRAWEARPLDPASVLGRAALAPFRGLWSEEVRTELFGDSVGLARTTHDEVAARAALAPLIKKSRVVRIEAVPDVGGTTSYTFRLAGPLAPDTSVADVCRFFEQDEGDIAFARVDTGARTELLAWLTGYDGFERYVETLALVALAAHGVATSCDGFFVPFGPANPDLWAFGELGWKAGDGAARFVVDDLQNLGEETEALINAALPRLVEHVGGPAA